MGDKKIAAALNGRLGLGSGVTVSRDLFGDRPKWSVAGGASVVHADVAEQVGHGLAVVDAADGLRQDHADVHRLDLRTLQLLNLVGDRVGHHHLGGEKLT